MTPFETLVFLRHRLGPPCPCLPRSLHPPVMPLCPACTAALLAEMAALFPDDPSRTSRSRCKAPGSWDTRSARGHLRSVGCIPYLQEDVVCR